MVIMEYLLDIDYVLFSLMGYNMSLVEFVGTIFGLLSVWFAARSKVLTWPVTLINTIAFFLVFYQVRLYSDMLLQIYFFCIAIYGWYYWRRGCAEATKPVERLRRSDYFVVAGIAIVGAGCLGVFMSRIHLLIPSIFPEPASFPFVNATSVILSMIANYLMATRKLENWYLWMLVDIICVVVYLMQGILLMSFEYLILFGLCIYGYRSWFNEFRFQSVSK